MATGTSSSVRSCCHISHEEASANILGHMGRGAAPALGGSQPPAGGPEAGEGARQKADRCGAPENSRPGGVEDKGVGRERGGNVPGHRGCGTAEAPVRSTLIGGVCSRKS